MKTRIIVSGLGRTGYKIYTLLRQQRADVVGISDRPISVSPTEKIIIGNSASATTLIKAGIKEAQTLILAHNDDALNLAILTQARLINPRVRIINRLFNQTLGERLDQTLPDHFTMSVASLSAPIFTFAALGSEAIGQLKLFNQTWPIHEEIIDEDHPWLGKSLKELWNNPGRMLIYYLPTQGEIDLVSAVIKVQAFKLGAVDYITKPFFIDEVVIRIETQLVFAREQSKLAAIIEEQIHERQIVEKQLNQSQALLAGVLNSSLDGVAAFESVRNQEGKIIDFRWVVANPVAAMTVGETRDSLLSQCLFDRLPGHLFDGLFKLFVQVVENCIVLEQEHFYKSDSLQAWFQIVAVKLNDGFAMTFRDITERKQMEIALQDANQELKRQANIDSLTQVANRRRFDEYILQEWARCARERQFLSLILCDVDYFKAYNDEYGHQAGDDCLYQVAQGMNNIIRRPADLVFRYGGEEFAIILPFTSGEGAIRVAEAIRQEIKQLKIPHNLSQVNQYVTLSLGISSIIPHHNSAPEMLIAAADRALYEAKAQGRDRAIYNGLEIPFFY